MGWMLLLPLDILDLLCQEQASAPHEWSVKVLASVTINSCFQTGEVLAQRISLNLLPSRFLGTLHGMSEAGQRGSAQTQRAAP